MNHPFPLASPQSWTWLSLLKYWTVSLPIEISLAWNRTIRANGRRLGISSPNGRLGTKGTRRGCKSRTPLLMGWKSNQCRGLEWKFNQWLAPRSPVVFYLFLRAKIRSLCSSFLSNAKLACAAVEWSLVSTSKVSTILWKQGRERGKQFPSLGKAILCTSILWTWTSPLWTSLEVRQLLVSILRDSKTWLCWCEVYRKRIIIRRSSIGRQV